MNAARYLAEELLADHFDRDSVTFKMIHGYTTACDLTHALSRNGELEEGERDA